MGYNFGSGGPFWNGIPMFGGSGFPITFGNYYYVNPDGTGGNGKSMKKAFKTLEEANDAVITNNNDVVMMNANSIHPLTSMLTVSKNRVHFVGLDGGGRMVDPRTRIELTGSTGAANVAALKVTGMGCSFTNLKIMNAHTVTESLYGVVAAGEDTVWRNCTIMMFAKQSTSTCADLLLQSTNDRFIECTIGNDNLVCSAARPNILCDRSKVNLTAACNNRFDRCEIVHWASLAAKWMVTVAADGDVYNKLLFKECEFVAKVAEGTLGATAVVNPPASIASGSIWFIRPSLLNILGIAADADKAGCYVNGPQDDVNTGISVNAQTTGA